MKNFAQHKKINYRKTAAIVNNDEDWDAETIQTIPSTNSYCDISNLPKMENGCSTPTSVQDHQNENLELVRNKLQKLGEENDEEQSTLKETNPFNSTCDQDYAAHLEISKQYRNKVVKNPFTGNSDSSSSNPSILDITTDSFQSSQYLSHAKSDNVPPVPPRNLLKKMMERKSKKMNVDTILDDPIARLKCDDPILLMTYPPINRDPHFILPVQNIGKFENKKIYLSQIFSPVIFWFQIIDGDNNFDEMSDLESGLQDYYKGLQEHELKISSENLTPGLIASCFYEENWYRVKIVSSDPSDETARVFFVDYGSVVQIEKLNLKYLLCKFLTYPKYAHRGRLYGIQPINNKKLFCDQIVEDFLKLVCGKELEGSVVRFDERQNVYELKLLEVFDDGIKSNVAQFLIDKEDAEKIKVLNDGNPRLKLLGPMCYYFPASFYEMETFHPSIDEIYQKYNTMSEFENLLEKKAKRNT
jgi:hypothetical protein